MSSATLCLLCAALLIVQGLVLGNDGFNVTPPQTTFESKPIKQGLVLNINELSLTPPQPLSKILNESLKDFLIKQCQDLKETNSQSPASQSYAIDSYNKGNRLYDIGKYDEATQAYSNATELNPKLIEAWNNKGNVFLSQNRLDDALQAYNRVLALDNKSAHAWGVKGWILIHKKYPQYSDALSSLEKAIELEPNTDNTAWYLNEKGNALYGLNRLPEALEAKNESLKLNPNLWFTWYDTAIVLDSMGNYGEALNAVNKSIEELSVANKSIESNPPDKDAQDAQQLKKEIQNELQFHSQSYPGSS